MRRLDLPAYTSSSHVENIFRAKSKVYNIIPKITNIFILKRTNLAEITHNIIVLDFLELFASKKP